MAEWGRPRVAEIGRLPLYVGISELPNTPLHQPSVAIDDTDTCRILRADADGYVLLSVRQFDAIMDRLKAIETLLLVRC